MNIFFSYIRVFVFLGCTLAGIQVPVFVDQYGKALESHLIESRFALNEFQEDANKYFGGSLEKLISHYLDSQDQIFNDGGRSIQSIYKRNLMLENYFERFQNNLWSAYTQALFFPVEDIRNRVWQNHSYAVQLNPGAIAFGLVTGLIITIIIEIFLRLLFIAPKIIAKKRHRQI